MSAGISLEQAQRNLDKWIAASEAIASSQSYTIDTGNGSRTLTRANAGEVQKLIEFWDAKVKALTPAVAGGRRRTRYVVPE